jgi:membrane protein
MKQLKFTFSLIQESFSSFLEDNALKLSAALSYYTIFSLAPMILVIISIAGIFLGRDAIQGQLFEQIGGLVGKQAAIQLQEIIKNAAVSNKSGTAAAIGIVTLIIGATGVFAEMQDSINYIWEIKSKPRKSWLQYLKNRLLSFSIILTLGFLMIVSLGVNTLVDLLSKSLERYFSEASVVLFFVLNIVIVIVVITALFSVIFKVLPDGHVKWKECIVGAAFTAILFVLGKFGISFYLGKSDLGATYGTSASIVILLTWVYYSSIILYFGAEFTKVYAKSRGLEISPNEHAVRVVRKEVEAAHPSEILSEKEKISAPKVVVNQLLETVTDFIEEKINVVKGEIEAIIAKLGTPVVYYTTIALIAFSSLIMIIMICGQLLNRWFDSGYLGYLALLLLSVILLGLVVFFKDKFLILIKKVMTTLASNKD